MSDYNQNDNGIKPISETSSGTSLTTPQSERRSGGYVERVSARIGRDIPPLNMEGISRFANSFGNQNLIHFPISETSPGFSSLSPSLQSPNMFTNSSSQVRNNVFNKFNIDLYTLYILIYDKTKCLLSLCNLCFKIIPPSPIPNDATQEMVESSGGAHGTMMISNNNIPHQPLDIDLPPQGCNRFLVSRICFQF